MSIAYVSLFLVGGRELGAAGFSVRGWIYALDSNYCPGGSIDEATTKMDPLVSDF